MKRARPGTLLALALAPALALAASQAGAQQQCPLKSLGTAKVAAVRDGRTLALADGRVLRLKAIEVTAQSRMALAALTAGRTLRLAALGPDHDRYGRLVAFAFARDAKQSLQQILLEQGEARVSARVGDKACAAALLAAEREARNARRGLWADPNFAPLPAESSSRIARQRGQFALVEGKVLSVHASGGTLYLNFGRHWTTGFSVVILRRNEARFAAAGLAPRTLEGRRLRVRGWIEERRGPVIVADAPEQIERVGAAGPSQGH
jgi:endonuclease YncB( thermonuclease family)